MRYIGLRESDQTKLQDWLNKSNLLLAEMKNEPDTRKRKAIIHRNRTHWRDPGLLCFLKGLSNNKCWYTEVKFSAEYPHVDHFRPKSYARDDKGNRCHDGYWWLAFDLENYRLAKPMPNTCKGTYFPLFERAQAVCESNIATNRERPMLLDPTDEDDVALIEFNRLGEPEPCKEPIVDLDDWDRERIRFSIECYGLDNKSLCEQRKATWVSIEAMFEEYKTFTLKAKRESCIESAGRVKQLRAELEKFLNPDKEFTVLIRDCFNAHQVGRVLYRQFAMMPVAA